MDIFGRLWNALTTIATGPLTDAEVDKRLADAAAKHPEKGLQYKTSIVDLFKVLGLDPSLDNRIKLAKELGYTGSLEDTAAMNIGLHKATMEEIAKRCRDIPRGG